MELYQVMRVTATTRAFSEAPVDLQVLYRALDGARFAPNGGNRQGWHVIVVTDAAARRWLRDLYQEPWAAYLGVRGTPAEPVRLFAENFHRAPVQLLVTVDVRALAVTDRDLDRQSIVGGGSVYPFVQNLLLALRQEELGAALTTMVIAREPEVRERFRFPAEHALAAHIVVGHPAEPFKVRLRRKPVEAFTTLETFDGSPFRPA